MHCTACVYSAALCIPAILNWLEQHGGLSVLRQRNNALCQHARRIIIDALWQDSKQDSSHKSAQALPPLESMAHMAAIPLPKKLAQFPLSQIEQPSQASSASSNRIHPLQQALWAQNYEVPIIETAHGTLMRISAQAYNHLDEYRSLGRALQLLQNAY